MKIVTALALLLAGASLTACIDEGPRPMRVSAPLSSAPGGGGVEGNWVDPNGIVSTFQGGAFTTRTTDSNQLLASGTYTNTSPGLVEINMTSLVRKTQSKVNCALVSPAQLNCTSDSGAQFSLSRRG
jgi:hypothetical protein